jgi:tagaturonate reductase
MRLNRENFSDNKQYPIKVLQFGEGGFLRAFVDWIIDKLNKEAGFNGGVAVVQPIDKGLVNMLNEQDGLYTLYLTELNNGQALTERSVIDCITKGINLYENYDEYLKLAENPELRFITSNTTEAGIAFDENDTLDKTPQNSFPAKLTSFLYHRFKIFNGDRSKGFIILPCELIDRNGEKLKNIVFKYAELWNLGEEFLNWLKEANTFCCTLVDRVVTGYPKDRMDEINKELSYEDKLVVEGEKFHLWVIEGPQWIKDEFPTDKIGLNVLFVDDMTPYRTRKVRILNGAHTSMVPVSYLYGIDTVKESVEDEVIGKFVRDSIFTEIIPTLDLSVDELTGFANAVIERFRNPFIKHYLMSISLNSMSKYETRVLPSVLEYLNRKGELPNRLVFSLAALIRFYKGERDGQVIALADDAFILDMYKKLWSEYDGSAAGVKKIVETVLANEKIWKKDLNKVEGLTDKVTKYLEAIEKVGIKEALKNINL